MSTRDGDVEGVEPTGWRESDASSSPLARDARLRRLRIRSWRRGTREMDLILGSFIDAEGSSLDPATLDAFEALMREDDGVLYRWVAGSEPPPPIHTPMVERLRAFRGFAG